MRKKNSPTKIILRQKYQNLRPIKLFFENIPLKSNQLERGHNPMKCSLH